jgi:hypothetical protein
MAVLLRFTAFGVGAIVAALTVYSAVRTFVVPRAVQDVLTRAVFVGVRRGLVACLRFARTYEQRDSILAFYAPIGLLALLPTWLILVAAGFVLMYWAAGVDSLRECVLLSGSSMLTLGFAAGNTLPQTVLVFAEATIGLILVALLIAYLPTIYAAFSRRETAVTLLEVRAGKPPSGIQMIERYHSIHGLGRLTEQWETWEAWFADIKESHASLPALVFFRSPTAHHSWVTAAGAVLDAASLALSTVDVPYDPQAALCIRSGFLTLRSIADFFQIRYESDPHFPADPISVTRAEFDAALAHLAQVGVPLKPDRDQAWEDFAGWRVNYDTVLLALVRLTMAPPAPWSADRVEGQYIPSILAALRGKRG